MRSASLDFSSSWIMRPYPSVMTTHENHMTCRQCKHDNETYCRQQLDTYGAKWPDTGIISQGGYSSHVRTHEHWYVRRLFTLAHCGG